MPLSEKEKIRILKQNMPECWTSGEIGMAFVYGLILGGFIVGILWISA